MERTEHTLRPFYEFLEPNPRAMKKLVNAYSVNRSLSVLLHLETDRERLAQWTILSMRWPIVSEYLEVYPEKADKIIKSDRSDIRNDLKELVGNDEITKILNGAPTRSKLDSAQVRQCSLLNGEQ